MKEVILSAPYGHACANCARSKCKCIIREAGGPCERCHRINKECVPSKTVRRRNLRKPAVVNSSWLEEKLDGLATLIQARKRPDTIIPSPQSSNAANMSPNHDTAKHQIESFHSTSFQFKHQPSSTRDEDEPSPAEAEEYFLSFQTCKSKYFPFVYIPSTTNALQLRQERPFLWLSIMAVSSKSTSQRQALGSKIRQTIAHEMVFQSEKNIDLLLGLLAFLGLTTNAMKSPIWQLATTAGFLSSTPSHPCLDFRYPLQIAQELSMATWKLPRESMATHGVGLVEKIFEITCTFADVMACLSPARLRASSGFDLGPQDYLKHLCTLIHGLPGGDTKFLPLLIAKIGQTLPSMLAPLSRHLGLSQTDSTLSEDSETASAIMATAGPGNNWDKDFNWTGMSRIGDKTPEIEKTFQFG